MMLLWLAVAWAQEPLPISAVTWQMSLDTGRTLVTEVGRLEDVGTARAELNYARDLVVFRGEDGENVRLLGDAMALDLGAGWANDWARIGLSVPVWVVGGQIFQGPAVVAGDPALRGKLAHVIGDVGLAVLGSIQAPLGGGRMISTGGWTGSAGIAADLQRDGVLVALNIESWFVPRVVTEEQVFGHQVRVRLAFGHAFEDWAPTVEFHGVLPTTTTQVAPPLEGMLSARWLRDGAQPYVGIGTGLSSGLGSPALRAVVGVRWGTPGADSE